MKKIEIFSIVIISFLGIILFSGDTSATTGGGRYITDIRYNKNNNTVYYLMSDYGGRGCPPELFSYNISTEKKRVVYDCDYAEKNSISYSDEIDSFMSGLTPLDRIDLENNDISANAVIDYNYHDDYYGQISYRASILQNDLKKATIDFPGCEFGQKVNLEGYVVPNINHLFILTSTKDVCFEFRYIGENLFYVSDFIIKDDTPLAQRSTQIEGGYDFTVYEPDGGIQIKTPESNQKISTYLNNLGFSAYKDANYITAINYFQSAYYDSFDYDNQPHLLSLFNLSATQSKIGRREDALSNIEDLLSRADEQGLKSYYATKIVRDNDFDSLRGDAEYIDLMAGIQIIESTPTPMLTLTPTSTLNPTSTLVPTTTVDLSVDDDSSDPNLYIVNNNKDERKFNVIQIILILIIGVIIAVVAYRFTRHP